MIIDGQLNRYNSCKSGEYFKEMTGMSIKRKMKRESMRKQVGTRNMEITWEQYQREKYGKDYKAICKKKSYELDPII